jgi:hypothetical protein
MGILGPVRGLRVVTMCRGNISRWPITFEMSIHTILISIQCGYVTLLVFETSTLSQWGAGVGWGVVPHVGSCTTCGELGMGSVGVCRPG